MALLNVEKLKLGLREEPGKKLLTKDISFDVNENEVVALVGGSGSGKTMTALSVLGLLPLGISIEEGKISFRGEQIQGRDFKGDILPIRGREIAMIFQEPLSALNPVLSIGDQMNEALQYGASLTARYRREKILELLEMAGIGEAKRVAKNYPHELSAGLRQRAMIALAMAPSPKLIIADEPTSNLDVTLQAHIIELFRKIKSQFKVSILLITHDLGVVRQLADRVAVMHDGTVVELESKEKLFSTPDHFYTKELLKALTL